MYRILLVDDEMPALRFLQAIIGKYAPDFSVCASYTNGAAALEYLGKYPVDLLITDISMDGMNGIELFEKLRLLTTPPPPILFISGHADENMQRYALSLGAAAFLRKPINIDILLDHIQRELTRRQ